jgi:hypothetical protein
MSQRDDDWGTEDENVVRRLRDGKPRISAFDLDRIKTTVMARARANTARRPAPRSRLLVAFLTVGLMVAGTAGTIAASNGSFSSGTGAAQSQYRPPKCNPRHEECKCPGGSVPVSRDRCECPAGETFAEGTNDCRCPNGSRPTDAGKCPACPSGEILTDSGRCVCPDHGTVVEGKCRKPHEPEPRTTTVTGTAKPGQKSSPPTGKSEATPASKKSTRATVTTSHGRTRH